MAIKYSLCRVNVWSFILSVLSSFQKLYVEYKFQNRGKWNRETAPNYYRLPNNGKLWICTISILNFSTATDFWHVQKFWKASLIFGKLKSINQLLLFLFKSYLKEKGFPGASVVKNPPAKPETQVQVLDQEDPLEDGIAIHSSILAWETPWMEKPGGLQSMGSRRVRHDWATEHIWGKRKALIQIFFFCNFLWSFYSHHEERKIGSPDWGPCRKELIFHCLVNSYKLEDLGERQ